MPCINIFIAADGAVYAARSATIAGKFQQMMARPVEGMAAIQRRLTVCLIIWC